MCCRLDGFLDNGYLTLVELEVDDFPGLSLLAGQVALDLALEAFPRQFLRLVQPGCTVKFFSASPSDLDQLDRFAPANFPELLLRNPATNSRELPSNSRPSGAIPGNASAGIRQKRSTSRAR